MSANSYALTMENVLDSNIELTDEMAQELGMTPVENVVANELKMMSKNASEGIDLKDDTVTSRLAKVVVIINEGDRDAMMNPEGQTAKLYIDGRLENTFDVSTGSRAMKKTTSGRTYIAVTGHGVFRPNSAHLRWFSRTFFGADMRYAVFFNGGIASHKTGALKTLGQRASGGCVRMKEHEAKIVNEAMRATGEGHDNYSSYKFCNSAGTKCYYNDTYKDRIQLPKVKRWTGEETKSNQWTYDAVYVVKPGWLKK
jgi:lipoprotein-anchoring transpeptidase ErfK/SrfK